MLHLIINPCAGNGRAKSIGESLIEILRSRGVDHQAHYTLAPGHATELAASLAKPGDTVAAVGGDGTILEVVRGLFGTGASLGIIPAGTGNDVVKMLNIPREPFKALDYLLTQPASPLDIGRCGNDCFMNICGTGFDVTVLKYAEKAKKYVHGLLPYLYGVIRTIFTYKPMEVTITPESGEPFTQNILVISIANGRFFGGGIEIAPQARPDDGLFDVILINPLKRRSLPFQLPKLLSGKVLEIPGAHMFRCRKIELRATKQAFLNVDGEVIPFSDMLFELLPGALTVHWGKPAAEEK